jgi:Trypsin/Family of unknown function (DUF5977)
LQQFGKYKFEIGKYKNLKLKIMKNAFFKEPKVLALAIIALVVLTINFIGCKKSSNEPQVQNFQNPSKTGVIGGNPISINNLPYQAAIFFNGNFNAGGVILNENWILTAAHVVTYPNSNTQIESNKITVKLGSSNVNDGVSYNADMIIRHANYNSSQIYDDIALIHLSTPISFNANISAISYSTSGDADVVVDMPATVSGWGAVSYNSSSGSATYPNTLFAANVKISSISPTIIYTSSTSTGSQQAPCFGDSGGPLVVDIAGVGKVLVGVVNGWGDCNVGAKGYAKVSGYASWILEKTGITRTFYNRLNGRSFYKNTCQSNVSYPLPVNYIVPAKKYSSTVSQADADAMALAEINQNGQQIANAQGACYLTMATPRSTNRYPFGSHGTRYIENITWNASLTPSDTHVKIELIELRSINFPGFNTYAYDYVVNQVINPAAPNTGQLLNGLDSDLLGSNIVRKSYQIRITGLTSGLYYLSDDFDLDYD